MGAWRLITDDHAQAAFGLAADETMTGLVGEGKSSPLLRLYTYDPCCALVGRFQNVANEINIAFCREQGIPINRRPTGGGAIIMGDGQMGLALIVPASADETYFRARDIMAEYAQGLVVSLEHLGIPARLRGKNDIEAGGRKIAGLGIYRAPNGGLLFHASLLVDLDIPLMLRALKLPVEKLSDKEIQSFSARITTIRRELQSTVSLDEVRREVVRGYEEWLHAPLEPSEFSVGELEAIHKLEKEKYQTEAWVFQTTEVADSTGQSKKKTPAGLLDVTVTLAGFSIKALYLQGDFFAADFAINAIEASLRWHTADPDSVSKTLRSVYDQNQEHLNRIPFESLEEVVLNAIWQARADQNAGDLPQSRNEKA